MRRHLLFILILVGTAILRFALLFLSQTHVTSDEAIGLREVPGSIAIMGSGAVGVEFASIFRRFGSEVTIIELLPRLVPDGVLQEASALSA